MALHPALIRRGALVDAWRRTGGLPADVPRRFAATLDHPAAAAEIRAFTERALAARGAPWPDTRLTDFARYPRDGDRSAYEAAVFGRMDRLAVAALAATAALDAGATAAPDVAAALLAEVADGVLVVCEQSTWCWPAHDDVFARTGGVVPDPTHPVLDLGAGEMAGLAAWIALTIGDELDAAYPGLLGRLAAEVESRVLGPFLVRRDWTWLTAPRPSNWSPWIHANVIAAGSAFADGPQRARIVELAVDELDRYLAVLPADGGIDEGVAYWWNGAGRALEALELLGRLTGGAFDPAAEPELAGIAELLGFPGRMRLGDEWVLGLADANPHPDPVHPWRIAHTWGLRFGLDDVVAAARAHRAEPASPHAPNSGLGRLIAALGDHDWQSAAPAEAPLPASVVLPSLAVALARERSDASGLAISLKGGHNAEHHNHNDLGSVTVALDGLPAIVDVGRPVYDARTFGPDRYDLWPVRSDWHSVPEPHGAVQAPGAGFRTGPLDGRDDAATGGPAAWSLDLSQAWPLGPDESWRRRIELDRERGVAIVGDDWRLAGTGTGGDGDGDGSTRTTWIAWGRVEVVGPGVLRVVRPVAGSRDLLVEHDAEQVELDHPPVPDEMVDRAWGAGTITRVRLRPAASARTATVRFRAADREATV
ncbi:hypothetical protein ABIQ69_13230 [Agromyces sp. G08B096]|uniref:Heparinase II/III-like protein n=1 Tax=Agromyces sp. G08B096 TaxID=3156399 RepID=A0AAU7W604_9MICO